MPRYLQLGQARDPKIWDVLEKPKSLKLKPHHVHADMLQNPSRKNKNKQKHGFQAPKLQGLCDRDRESL